MGNVSDKVKIFLRFLKENNAYVQFVNTYANIKFDYNSSNMFHFINNHQYNFLIMDSFDWEASRCNINWAKIHIKWDKFVRDGKLYK